MLSTDKAYLFGLFIGAGDFGPGGFSLKLPYKSWGDQLQNPTRAGQVASDILLVLNPLCSTIYGFSMAFTPGRNWTLFANKLPVELVTDLEALGLPKLGELRTSANLDLFSSNLSTAGKQAFIIGLADAIGSLQASHRRFSSDYQVVSLEFAGFNYSLVAKVLEILDDVDCVVDQVLWNHPNQHSGSDRYYKSWKKGMKIRVMLGEFASQAGFGFKSKVLSAVENAQLQHDPTVRTGNDRIVLQPKAVHVDETSNLLPQEFRGEHFLHWQHLAWRLGAATVSSGKITSAIAEAKTLVTPFTLLTKGLDSEITDYLKADLSLREFKFRESSVLNVKSLINRYLQGERQTHIGDVSYFLTTGLVEACIYPILGKLGLVSGRRYKGKLVDVCRDILTNHESLIESLVIKIDPNFVSPIWISGFGYSAVSGPICKTLNEKLISVNSDTLALKVRNIEAGDLVGWKSEN